MSQTSAAPPDDVQAMRTYYLNHGGVLDCAAWLEVVARVLMALCKPQAQNTPVLSVYTRIIRGGAEPPYAEFAIVREYFLEQWGV